MDHFNPRAQYGLELIREFQDKIHRLYSIPPVVIPVEHPKEKAQTRVCIIGAGTAGLYSAMLLDWIRLHLGVVIPYDIFEASARDGGRVWTHHFSAAEFDYYDLGPMRYPNIPVMSRIFDLFKRLGIGEVQNDQPNGRLIPFLMTAPNTVLLYNDVRYVGSPPTGVDTFKVGVNDGGLVPNPYVSKGYQHWINISLEPFRKAFVDEQGQPTWECGWDLLKKFDNYSVRSFMATEFSTPFVKEAIPAPVIDWCESMASSTGVYDTALSEAVLSSIIFNYPFPELTDDFPLPKAKGAKETKWYCIRGGSEVLVDEMVKNVQVKPQYGGQVTKIVHNKGDAYIGIHVNGAPQAIQYTHTISTIPLSTLRLVEFGGNACLDYAQRTAFRTLEYMPSVKIALKFTTRWWTRLPQVIRGGRSGTDLNLRSIVYPSYGGDGDSGVLLVSYTLGQDALRLGALSRTDRLPLKYRNLVLQELARIHNVSFDYLLQQCESDWIWNWSAYEYSNGAFAHFGPGQFEGLYPHVTRPAAAGRLHIVGEATSVLHGWINGALESAMRGVLQMLDTMKQFGEIAWTDAQRDAFIREWHLPAEVNIEYLQEQIRIGAALTSGEVPTRMISTSV